MNAKMTTTATEKLCLDNSTHIRCSRRDTENIAQRDCDPPILSIIAIPGEVGVPRSRGPCENLARGHPLGCVFVCVCVCVCVLGGFRGQLPRSNNPPLLGWPGWPKFSPLITPPLGWWCGLWRGVSKILTRVPPMGQGGGGDGSPSLRRLWLLLQRLCPLPGSVVSRQILPTSVPKNSRVGTTTTATDKKKNSSKGTSWS